MLHTAFGVSCMKRTSVFEWHKRFKEGRVSVRDAERYGRSKEVNRPELIVQRFRVRVTMLRFKGVQTIHSTRIIHQSASLSFSQTIWPRWASRHVLTLPIVKTLPPVTFLIPLAQRLSLWDNWGDERSCDEGHLHAYTWELQWGLPEVVGTVQQAHCSW